jgi:hypothetical protein
MELIAKRIEKKRQKFPLFAGMPFDKPNDMKIRKIGSRTVEFTYDVDIYSCGYEDWMLIGQKEIKRKIK